MANDTINTINLLPEFFRTDKNTKFLSATLDQLIQPPQLERIDGYIGTTATVTYTTSDVYISESLPLRQHYQLDPALVVYNSQGVVKHAVGIDDLTNEINTLGGIADNFDRLYRSEIYSYDPHIDWDKFTNYQDYYWLPTGPATIVTTSTVNLINISTLTAYTTVEGIALQNGMKIQFSTGPEYIVEGIGKGIQLVDYSLLLSSDVTQTPEYVTINRASIDLNPWTRYNRWIYKDVIKISAEYNNQTPVYLADKKAVRPIIEFKPNLKLYNFGSFGIPSIDYIDTITINTGTVNGSYGYYVDGNLLKNNDRVIFKDSTTPETIYVVNYSTVTNKIQLTESSDSSGIIVKSSVNVNSGNSHGGTSWWYNGSTWVYAQQHTTINQAPLFDLFDKHGIGYGDQLKTINNFKGSKIFGYTYGTFYDSVLGFNVAYQANIKGIGSLVFDNYFMNETISVYDNLVTISIPTKDTYIVVDGYLANVWSTSTTVTITTATDNAGTYYNVPLGTTNNPLNGSISNFSLTELSNHYTTNNTRLVSNVNPIVFSNFFIGNKEHNVVDAIQKVSDQYGEFKLSFLSQIIQYGEDPVAAVDGALTTINKEKTINSPYHFSDMIAYGEDKIVKKYIVANTATVVYPITTDFSLSTLSNRSVLVYINDVQLIYNTDYLFTNDSSIEITTPLQLNDVITINDYIDTTGCYIPPTPTKLGLYPAFEPKIYIDNTYIVPTPVIQGHDGSITVAYNDYRDAIILEYETRVYNNLKTKYRPELFDINALIPGAFKNTDYSSNEITNILVNDFIRWSGVFGIDYKTNTFYDPLNSFTWNYSGATDSISGVALSGYWRNVYKYFYNTDRPHTHPWETLGYSIKPTWWTDSYNWGPALLSLLRPSCPVIDSIIPVDSYGNLKNPTDIFIIDTKSNISNDFVFGDQAPTETAWRRSSFYPFAVQRLLALIKPADYCSLMFDPSRMSVNLPGQWTYGTNQEFLNIKTVSVFDPANDVLSSGYNVFVVEVGNQRNAEYLQTLKDDLTYLDVNLFHKVGGFISKNTIQLIIDAYEPTSTSPGAILPPEDYSLYLNTSNPISSIGISGIIIQKSNGYFVVKGYDKFHTYFNINKPIRGANTPFINIGGISESYVIWTSSGTSGGSGLTSVDTTSANSATGDVFYKQGQLVRYGNIFYRVKVSHVSGDTFDSALFTKLSGAPTVGGAMVQTASQFETVVTQITYGTKYSTLQEVYDFIIGYGNWLTSQGFIFDEYNSDLDEIINWNFSGKEFLYWTTQNWADNSVITLSPFADQIKFSLPSSVVDNIFDSFYEYSLLQASGLVFPRNNINVNRQNGVCTISTKNTANGIYFARLNSVQKEHAMVFKNKTIFGDVIFDIETGYRQLRMKLIGFRTSNWNGDFYSPGFVYDSAQIYEWTKYHAYQYGDVVRFAGNYYSAKQNISGSLKFNVSDGWILLGEKPVANLLPNFDYKINQFEDFYSLDIDNFDAAQEKMAQHLTGYTPRVYLNNIFTDPVAQYKFYQGYIREKGTRNAVTKLAKASVKNLQGQISYTEEWAFRVGAYGAYSTYQELEIPLVEGTFLENPQIVNMVSSPPADSNNLIYYALPENLAIIPDNFNINSVFTVNSGTNELAITTAGYVRLDDVDSTAFNENSILDIADNSLIKEGSYIWLGFKNNNGWDILRYEKSPAKITGVYVSAPLSEITCVTDLHHKLSVNDIISITQFNSQVNGIYIVKSVVLLTEFTVASPLASITNATLPSPGILYKFASQRFINFDSIPVDSYLLNLPYTSKLWIDDVGNGTWAVYQKTKNYAPITIPGSPTLVNQQLGQTISKRKGSNVVVTSAPGYKNDNLGSYGRIFVYNDLDPGIQVLLSYPINSNSNSTIKFYETNTIVDAGYSLVYDDILFGNSRNTQYGLIFAGTPGAGKVRSNSPVGGLRYSTGTETASVLTQEGLVKISSISVDYITEIPEYVLLSPHPVSNERFGSSIYVQRNTSTKTVLVGAPGTPGNTGTVYHYTITTGTNTTGNLTTTTNLHPVYVGILTTSSVSTGSNWGYSISGSDNAEYIAISAVGLLSGFVSIFTGTSLTYSQTLNGIDCGFKSGDKFGQVVQMSPGGEYLFVSATRARCDNQSLGQVAVFTNSNGVYVLDQILTNPVPGAGTIFGSSIDITAGLDNLVVGSVGYDNNLETTFDITNTETLFDSNSTQFIDAVRNGGTVYVYNKKNSRFALAENLTTSTQINNSFFGTSVAVDNNVIYVGAPASTGVSAKLTQLAQAGTSTIFVNSIKEIIPGFIVSLNPNDNSYTVVSIEDGDNPYIVLDRGIVHSVVSNTILTFYNKSFLYQYNKIDKTINSWNTLRYQDDLVDINQFQKITLIDTFKDKVIDYLDIIDPVKGKITGIADQELKYKSAFDPAVYSIGTTGTVIDTSINWLDNHVGELWWDLSTVKYFWYEQGELEYRKNNWGQLFPGATIDIYEWIGSTYLPSEWSTLADTAQGLAEGVSGQPKYSDNTVVSVKQIYDSITNSFGNYYYYWVKNKVTVPNVAGRRNSAYQVASLISDPKSSGLMYMNALSSTAVALSNVGDTLIDSRIHLNINFDVIDNANERHTEWLLLQEGNPSSVPNTLLEKKFFDSLLGHDSFGNVVPDPMLSSRMAYGISIRPRQGMFINRGEALRNVVDFVNGVLSTTLLTGSYNFTKLNSEESYPAIYSNLYDEIVEDDTSLAQIDTRQLRQAKLTCQTINGKIDSITITDSGFGYQLPPLVSVYGSGTGAVFSTEIDPQGQIINCIIEKSGSEYLDSTTLDVRPYSVIVKADASYNGKWALFAWNIGQQQWNRIRTQSYNTKLYWNYIDWSSTDYNSFINFNYTIDAVYLLDTVSSNMYPGEYIKIKNGGDGNYLILEKIDPTSTVGTFDINFNIVYKQNGTIQLSSTLWNLTNNINDWDEGNNWDQTLFDQTVNIELKNILLALKNDIFVGTLKVNWNLLFFKSVKYALTEQKLLDWAFKTSFINVVNNAGELAQRPVYKLQDTSSYESYLQEVKPYHTQIRSFTASYSNTDSTNTRITDFDLPPAPSNGGYIPVNIGDAILSTEPWKDWNDNYKYYIGSIDVSGGGANYLYPPTVEIVSAVGDTGYGATAKAFITSGTVSQILVTNTGTGYTQTPDVILNSVANVLTVTVTATVANTVLFVNTISNITVGYVISSSDNLTIPPGTTIIEANYDYASTHEYFVRLSNTLTDQISSGTSVTVHNFTSTFVPAKAYAQLENKKVRNNLIGIKFDRTTGSSIINRAVSDSFVCDGKTTEFVLTWLAQADKLKIAITLDGHYVLSGDYTVVYYTQLTNGYLKKYSKIVFLDYTPLAGQILNIQYVKSIDLLNAVERIEDAMPDRNLSEFMTGLEYPNTQLEGLPFTFSPQWDKSWVVDNRRGSISAASSYDIDPWASGVTSDSYIQTTIYQTALAGTNTLYISTTTGITVGQSINIISTTSNVWNIPVDIQNTTTGVYINLVSVLTSSTKVTVNTTISQSIHSGSAVEIWMNDATAGVDIAVEGGTWSNAVSIGALGINPNDIIITGDAFLTPESSYAPEEVVPGQTVDSLAINVYTRSTTGAPLVYSNYFAIEASTASTYIILPDFVEITTPASISVVFDNILLDYLASGDLNSHQFSLDMTTTTNVLVVGPQLNSGIGGYTIVGIGGSQNESQAGVIDSVTAMYPASETTVELVSLSDINTVHTATVYVNGISIPMTSDLGTLGFTLSASNINSNRAAVHLHGLDASGGRVVAWFFGTAYTYHNEIKEENFIYSQGTADMGFRNFYLHYPPGNAEPIAPQAIVELDQNGDENYQILRSPVVSYYNVTNTVIREYLIDSTRKTPSSNFNLTNVRVYINGQLAVAGSDFTVNDSGIQPDYPTVPRNPTVTIAPGLLHNGDVLAIVGKPTDTSLYDYDIQSHQLSIVDGLLTSASKIRVITYTNHDNLFMRVESFSGQTDRRYKISRPVLSDNYIWVLWKKPGNYGFVPLVNKVDYTILDDGMTVQLSDSIFILSQDSIEIRSIGSQQIALNTLGYRMFTDIFNRTHFKRLSAQNTTYLKHSLSFTDTEIYVADATTLSAPNINKKIPGVVLIDGERIEYYSVNHDLTNNVYILSQLRRATLGTSPSFYSEINTRVIDQGIEQTIPYSDSIYVQSTFTNYTQSIYSISTVSQHITVPFSTATIFSDGITLTTSTMATNTITNPMPMLMSVDQLDVYYGGHLLRKSGMFIHDSTIAYDSPEVTVYTTTASETLLPSTATIGTAYLISTTNKVWVQTNSNEVGAINGFVYKGLNYLPPDYSVTITNSVQQLVLNTSTVYLEDNVKLTIVKKEISVSSSWNDIVNSTSTLSLLDSTSIQARFLQARPAELPDSYYYGGDPMLRDGTGIALTDSNSTPLEGI